MIDVDKAPSVGARILWLNDGGDGFRVVGWNGSGIVQVHAATSDDVHLLAHCDGTVIVRSLAANLGRSIDEVIEALDRWSECFPSAFSWKTPSRSLGEAHRLETARQMLREMDAVAISTARDQDNSDYHLHGISDALEQFENVETTVSHAYSAPRRALRGRTYGEAFFDALGRMKPVDGPLNILEIGCGTGRFARAFLDRFRAHLPEAYAGSTYTMFDLSPSLAASQRVLCADHEQRIRWLQGDIERQPPQGEFDFVIANEMIADLSVQTVSQSDVAADRPDVAYIRDYDLDMSGALDRFIVNRGAIRLVESLPTLLAPAGLAIITEYGSTTAFPYSVQLGDHVEYSIHFGHLASVASKLGLQSKVDVLTAFLDFDPTHEVVSRDTLALLRAVSRELLGVNFEAQAYDRDELSQLLGEHYPLLGNIVYAKVASTRSFMSPQSFRVLTALRRADGGGTPT
jgi:SAM-dependent methyltransferase